MSDVTELEFSMDIARIAAFRGNYTGVPPDAMFRSITENHSPEEFRNFLALHFKGARRQGFVGPDNVKQNNEEYYNIEGEELRRLDKRFLRQDRVVVYFVYSDNWCEIIRHGSFVNNGDMVGGRLGACLLLPLAVCGSLIFKLSRIGKKYFGSH